MKSFFKFLVTIIVILVVGFTIYFLMKNMSQYSANNNSDVIIDNLNNEQSGNVEINSEVGNQNENTEIKNDSNLLSGDNISVEIEQNNTSGELAVESGEKYFANDWELKVEAIKNIESQNESVIPNKTLEDNVGIEIIGTSLQVFLQAFETEEVSVTVQVAGSMVYILPTSDFLDNMQFHYDENGKLVLYVREFIGIGGEGRYYFENDEPIIINMDVEKKSQMQFENLDEILQRSKVVYDRYMK